MENEANLPESGALGRISRRTSHTGMAEMNQNEMRWSTRAFWIWLAARTALWTALISFTQPNAPLDLIEWLAWGREWQWGYPKHPPLAARIAEIFFDISGKHIWGVYLAGYVCAAICLYAVWRLAIAMGVPPRIALIAAVAMDGLTFLNYDAADFSNNIVLAACWAAATLCFYHALRSDRLRWWAGLGLAMGLGFLTKYTMVLLIAPMIWVAIQERAAGRLLRRPGPYLAMAIASALFAPHAAWMVRTHFMTVEYAVERSASKAIFARHMSYPLLFALSQLGRILPVLFILQPLTSWRWRAAELSDAGKRDRNFLLIMIMAPLGLLLVESGITGGQLREVWGWPLWTFTALLVLVAVRIRADARAIELVQRHFAIILVCFIAFTIGRNVFLPSVTGKPLRIHFPGRPLADAVTQAWMRRFDQPLALVGGEPWIAGNICAYAPQRPSLYSSGVYDTVRMDSRTTPWASDAELQTRGGVLVWNAAAMGDNLPAELRSRFPNAISEQPMTLPYQCRKAVPPARIGVAFVPPK